MSDLLPLVAAILNDKAAVDAQEELTQLTRELNIARCVEVLHSDPNTEGNGIGIGEDTQVTVYASAQFQEGEYGGNPNLWTVNFEHKTTCRLEDLRSCRICVGGGIQIESLDDQQGNRADYEGFLDRDEEEDSDDSKAVSVCFCPNSMWLHFVVRGWPREEWEAAADNVNPEDIIEHLVETVAVNHPNATVEFKDIAFVVRSVHGALKRLLPPRRQQEVQAERERRLNNEEYLSDAAVRERVARTMRARGNQNNSARFQTQLQQVMDILDQIRFRELGHLIDDNEDMITFCIAQYEELGEDRFSEITRNALLEIIRRIMARNDHQEAADEEGENMVGGNEE